MTNEQYEALSAKLEGLKEIINGDYGVLEATSIIENKKNEAVRNFNLEIQKMNMEIFENSLGYQGFYIRTMRQDLPPELWFVPYTAGSFSVFGSSPVNTTPRTPIRAYIPFSIDEIEDIIPSGYYSWFIKRKNGDLYFASTTASTYLGVYNNSMYLRNVPALTNVDKLFLPHFSNSESAAQAYATTKNGDLYVVGHGGSGALYTNSTANITAFSRTTKPQEGEIKKIDTLGSGATATSIMLFADGNIYGVGNNYARHFGTATASFTSATKLAFEGVKDAMLLGDNTNNAANTCVLALLYNDGTLGITGANQNFHPSGTAQNENALKIVDEQNRIISGIKQIEGVSINQNEIWILALTDEGNLYIGGKGVVWGESNNLNLQRFKLISENVEKITNSERKKGAISGAQILARLKNGRSEIYAPKRGGTSGLFGGIEVDFNNKVFHPVSNSQDDEVYIANNGNYPIVVKQKSNSPFFTHTVSQVSTNGLAKVNSLAFLE